MDFKTNIDIKRFEKALLTGRKSLAKKMTNIYKSNAQLAKENIRSQVKRNFFNPSQRFLNSIQSKVFPVKKDSISPAATLNAPDFLKYFEDDNTFKALNNNYLFIPLEAAKRERMTRRKRGSGLKSSQTTADLDKFFRKYKVFKIRREFDKITKDKTEKSLQQAKKKSENLANRLKKQEENINSRRQKLLDNLVKYAQNYEEKKNKKPSVSKVNRAKLRARNRANKRSLKLQKNRVLSQAKSIKKSVESIKNKRLNAVRNNKKNILQIRRQEKLNLKNIEAREKFKRNNLNKSGRAVFLKINGRLFLGANKASADKKNKEFEPFFLLVRKARFEDKIDFKEEGLKMQSKIQGQLKNIKVGI